MAKWLNTTKRIWPANKERPCWSLGYCPYGGLVEEYPIKKNGKYSCHMFGHDCPSYYLSESICE